MRIVLASSEAVPFSKTGGLADVEAALAKALNRAGHRVWLIVPHYPQQHRTSAPSLEMTGQSMEIGVGSTRISGTVLQSRLPASDVLVYLVDCPDYFDRSGLYQQDGRDYDDNCQRFVFFSRAVMETVRLFNLRPEILHANDWQTGLVPALLAIESREAAGFEQTASVFTIHNLAFQGIFHRDCLPITGLDWKYFNMHQMEYFGQLNLLKTGVVFADMATTVSPSYAREIQINELGCGLHDVLRTRSDHLVGILNGVDVEVWNPKTDPALAKNYNVETFRPGGLLSCGD